MFYLLNFWNSFFNRLTILLVISFSLNLAVLAQEVALKEVQLSSQEQINLDQGQVILKGRNGDYIGLVLATGNTDVAWEVLTDYDNFQDFLPNIVSSILVSSEGDHKVFEQINEVDLWLYKEQFTVQIAATEMNSQKIDFQILKGDLKHLQGTWELQVIDDHKILITHTVKVEPESNTEKPFFYGIYESSLEETLKAIAIEITKRSQS